MADDPRLTRKEIGRVVHNWIGVEGGYLGNFSYASHDRFWLEVCDIAVNTADFPGTTRACFEQTLLDASAGDQAAVLRAILEEHPPRETVDERNPNFRSSKLLRDMHAWIARLETGQVAVEVELASASEIVRRALDDADALIRSSGPQSAVDRLHTALHAYLHALTDEAGVEAPERATMNQLLKLLRKGHPALRDLGPRSEDVNRIFMAMATILDALNPLRNNASVAHPNRELVGVPEAVLVANSIRTLLGYLEAKRREAAGGSAADSASAI